MRSGSSNTKSGRSRPRLKSSTGPPASSERRGSSQNTDRAEARPSPAPPGCQRHAGSRPASSPQESERQREPQSRRGLHRAQHLRQRRNVGSRTDAHHRCAERDLDRPAWNCAGGCRRWRRTLHNHRRESHAARGGALTTDSSPLRIAPPAEQLLRRQTMSPCDSPDFVPALIAPCENRRLLLRRPRAPSARSGEDLKPSNRLTLRLVQKLSVRHVSNPLPTQTTSDNRPLANALEGAIKGPLTIWSLPRRPEHENPRRERRLGQSGAPDRLARPTQRYRLRARVDRRL